MRIWAIAAALLASGTAHAQETPPELPNWMAGCWEQRQGDRWTEECWTIPRGGTMMGSSRSGTGKAVREWEALQILPGDPASGAKLIYWASPGGKTRTAFAWDPSDTAGLTFVNRDHDYPQRIRYWREGEELVAEISLADGTRPMRWRYKRMGG